jgi:Ca-activated chloride channel homolog
MAMLLKKIPNGVRVLPIAILTSIGCSSLFTQDNKSKEELNWRLTGPQAYIVNVFATVRDIKGDYKNDLLSDDFNLKVDGKYQAIDSFSTEADLPLTIGMIVDYSPSMIGVATQLQESSQSFFKKMLRPGKDQLFIMKFEDIVKGGKKGMTFDGQIKLVQDSTSDAEKIEKAANQISSKSGTGQFWDAEFETMLADSIIYAATNKFMTLLPLNRKVLIVLGDGYHVGNHLDQAVLPALEAGVSIFTIHIFDPNFGSSNLTDGDVIGGFFDSIKGHTSFVVYWENLRTLSKKTGGAYFEFEYNAKKSLDDIFGKIEKELHSYYSIGYMPSDSKKSGCRKLDLIVKNEGLTVHAPESYCPPGSSAGKKSSSKTNSQKTRGGNTIE